MSQKKSRDVDQNIGLNNAENSGQIGQAGRDLIQVGRGYIQYIYNNSRRGYWEKVTFASILLFLFLYGAREVGVKVVETSTPTSSGQVEESTRPEPTVSTQPTLPNSDAAYDATEEDAAAKRAEEAAIERRRAEEERIAAEQEAARKRAEEEARRRDSMCILTITNSLVPLRSEPENFSQELSRVEVGEYVPISYSVTNFGGLRDEGWFLIEAGGRRGWIKDDTWTIDSKTRLCQ